MVIRGRTRGNGRQLANYLLFLNENENIQILDVAGRPHAEAGYLHDTLFCMSLTSELTKSDKGLYHAQINPAYGDDAAMTFQSWQQAADMLGHELGLTEQRRVIVLHTKKGRTHAHVVWERYDLAKGRMISDSFSRLAQDRARKEMERVFEHKQTPHRNAKRPEMKDVLSKLWQKEQTAKNFIKSANEAGYIIAAGVQRRPFMVIDDTGRSFDLVRQLDGVKTKNVREKLKGEKLPGEKEAIAGVRATQKASDEIPADNNETQKQKTGTGEKKKTNPVETSRQLENNRTVAVEFAANRGGVVEDEGKEFERRRQVAADTFAMNRDEALAAESTKERKRRQFLEQLKDVEKKQKDKEHEYE